MYKIFEQRIVYGPTNSRGVTEAIDVSYDHIFTCNDSRTTLRTAKEFAAEAVETAYGEGHVVEVSELSNPVHDGTAEGGLYPAVVVGAVHILRGNAPIHSFFIEYTKDV